MHARQRRGSRHRLAKCPLPKQRKHLPRREGLRRKPGGEASREGSPGEVEVRGRLAESGGGGWRQYRVPVRKARANEAAPRAIRVDEGRGGAGSEGGSSVRWEGALFGGRWKGLEVGAADPLLRVGRGRRDPGARVVEEEGPRFGSLEHVHLRSGSRQGHGSRGQRRPRPRARGGPSTLGQELLSLESSDIIQS